MADITKRGKGPYKEAGRTPGKKLARVLGVSHSSSTSWKIGKGRAIGMKNQ